MFSILLSSLIVVAAPIKSSNWIIGGDKLPVEKVPQIQGLSIDGDPLCTATLVGPKVIITAAHCCDESYKINYYNASHPEVVNPISFEKHPAFELGNCSSLNMPNDFALKNDICLAVLDHEVEDINPISLNTKRPVIGERVMLVGLGMPELGVRQMGEMIVDKVSDIGASLKNAEGKITADGGDSGGATLRIAEDGEITYIGATSTSTRDYGICDEEPFVTGIALASTESAHKFYLEFAKKHQVEICGVNKTCAPIYW